MSIRRLGLAAIVLAAATWLVPWPFASWWTGGGYAEVAALRAEVGSGLADFWALGSGALPPRLDAIVEFWRTFHVAKAVLAGGLFVVLVMLASRLPRWWAALAGGAAFVDLLVVIANVQGALAPLTSVLTFLEPGSPATSPLRAAISSGSSSPALTALVDDFVRFHWVVAALTLGIGMALVITVLRRPRSGHVRVVGVVAAAAFGILAAANVSTALDPLPAFAASP